MMTGLFLLDDKKKGVDSFYEFENIVFVHGFFQKYMTSGRNN